MFSNLKQASILLDFRMDSPDLKLSSDKRPKGSWLKEASKRWRESNNEKEKMKKEKEKVKANNRA